MFSWVLWAAAANLSSFQTVTAWNTGNSLCLEAGRGVDLQDWTLNLWNLTLLPGRACQNRVDTSRVSANCFRLYVGDPTIHVEIGSGNPQKLSTYQKGRDSHGSLFLVQNRWHPLDSLLLSHKDVWCLKL